MMAAADASAAAPRRLLSPNSRQSETAPMMQKFVSRTSTPKPKPMQNPAPARAAPGLAKMNARKASITTNPFKEMPADHSGTGLASSIGDTCERVNKLSKLRQAIHLQKVFTGGVLAPAFV